MNQRNFPTKYQMNETPPIIAKLGVSTKDKEAKERSGFSHLLPRWALATFSQNRNKTLRQSGWIALYYLARVRGDGGARRHRDVLPLQRGRRRGGQPGPAAALLPLGLGLRAHVTDPGLSTLKREDFFSLVHSWASPHSWYFVMILFSNCGKRVFIMFLVSVRCPTTCALATSQHFVDKTSRIRGRRGRTSWYFILKSQVFQ